MKPTAKISGVLNSIVPRHSVATQLKIFTPVGIAIRNELIMKKTSTIVALGVENMWCAHTSSAEERDDDRRRGDRLVAEDRLAGEDRQDLGDDPEARQDHDVDLGVPEEPEQVLPQQRVAALARVEEVRAEVAVGQQQRHGAGDHRQREDQQDRVDEDRPDEQRQAAPAHAGRAHVARSSRRS